MYVYSFLLRMTDIMRTISSQNIGLSSWDTVYWNNTIPGYAYTVNRLYEAVMRGGGVVTAYIHYNRVKGYHGSKPYDTQPVYTINTETHSVMEKWITNYVFLSAGRVILQQCLRKLLENDWSLMRLKKVRGDYQLRIRKCCLCIVRQSHSFSLRLQVKRWIRGLIH
jgi:hypothetical protein